MLEARASTGEPLYALSCLFLTCSGGPEEAGAPPDMLGKSEGKTKQGLLGRGAAVRSDSVVLVGASLYM